MFKLFSDLFVKAFNFGLMLYWIVLTLVAVFIGIKTLKRLIGEAL
jgi:membrane protein insertase Oxa1/YidC/SpoIIIJ